MTAHFPILLNTPLGSMEILLMVLLAAGITAISAIFFVCWLFWVLLRLLADGMNYLLAAPQKRPGLSRSNPYQACPDPICRGINPTAARFCRQCGRPVSRTSQVSATPAVS